MKDSSGEIGVRKVLRKPSTVPLSPKLSTSNRTRRQSTAATLEDKPRQFKALRVGEGVPHYKASYAPVKPLTEVQPFTFATEQRAETHKSPVKESPTNKKLFKARKIPSTLDQPASLPTTTKRALTVPESPSLRSSQRHRDAKKALEEKIEKEKKEEQEKMSSFKARKVMEGVPKMINRQPIYKPQYDVKPFNISDDPTGARARLQRQIEKNEEEDRENREFRARPVPSTHVKPFQISQEHMKKPLTEAKPFRMLSNKRGEEHNKFSAEAKKRRELLLQQKRLQEEQEKKAADEAYRAKMEAQMFRAKKSKEDVQKFMKSVPKVIQCSGKRLVQPRSPKLGAARRVLVTKKRGR